VTVRRVIADQGFANGLLAGVDSVIHHAAISKDPSAELQRELAKIGGKKHRDLVGLMETIARTPGVAR
jgi:hypothetical protein